MDHTMQKGLREIIDSLRTVAYNMSNLVFKMQTNEAKRHCDPSTKASCVGERQRGRNDGRGALRVRGKAVAEYYLTICLR